MSEQDARWFVVARDCGHWTRVVSAERRGSGIEWCDVCGRYVGLIVSAKDKQ